MCYGIPRTVYPAMLQLSGLARILVVALPAHNEINNVGRLEGSLSFHLKYLSSSVAGEFVGSQHYRTGFASDSTAQTAHVQ